MRDSYFSILKEMFYKLEELDGIRNEIKENDGELFEEILEIEDAAGGNINFDDAFDFFHEYLRKVEGGIVC